MQLNAPGRIAIKMVAVVVQDQEAIMKTVFRWAMCLVVMSLGIPGAVLADGDPVAGQEAAREWCAGCHNVEPGGKMKRDPPSFAAIASYRSPNYIHAKITFPHERMPEIAQFHGLNVNDLVAYILSLEEPCF